MAQHRLQRINEVLRRELARALLKLVPLPPGALLTVNRVRIAADLRHADVYLSLIGGEAKLEEQVLARAAEVRGELQHIIGRHIKMKFTPHLHFISDHSVEEGTRILQILDNLPPPAPDEPVPPPETAS
ncbi:MAG TPA: 30S ribosome-binding factor RbfA [Verrucomicrobiae bacterium]|nr:30S ribosome-binding factor RbfA [Verrucomicrobiae bacterium]